MAKEKFDAEAHPIASLLMLVGALAVIGWLFSLCGM